MRDITKLSGYPRSNVKIEEETTITLQQMFSEMFKKHEESIVQILMANNNLSNQRIDKLTKKISELEESIQFTDNDLNNKIAKLEQNHRYEINMVHQKLRGLEDRSRRNNLRIDGVPKSNQESWDDTESKINDLLKDKLNVEGIEIERAHRGKLTKYQKDNNQPRTIVMKMKTSLSVRYYRPPNGKLKPLKLLKKSILKKHGK